MTAFSYRKGDTALHRMGAGTKLALLFGVSSSATVFGPVYLLVAAILIYLGARAALLSPADLFFGVKPLAITLAAVGILRTLQLSPPGIDLSNLGETLRFAGGVLVSFAAGSVVFATTKISAMREALGAGEVWIRRLTARVSLRPACCGKNLSGGTNSGRLSLGIALVLAFLPRIFTIWEKTETAYRARFGRIGLRRVFLLVPLTTERLMEAAAETARALVVRGAE